MQHAVIAAHNRAGMWALGCDEHEMTPAEAAFMLLFLVEQKSFNDGLASLIPTV